ncbi:adenylate/guanylate cyclase domain-containing protein [Gordonia amicalis]|uniref:adenylate/guanylate cyclase domain-containing protein n=1 Tax=Gordonia amicalis TaxID=89053 RepID=UPI002E231349
MTEYKQVTVLFADVVKSMDLAAAMDAERWQQIITSLAERSAAVARRRGGRVDFTGDGVMAIFGAPKALEDHAFRGCQAALESRSRLGGWPKTSECTTESTSRCVSE